MLRHNRPLPPKTPPKNIVHHAPRTVGNRDAFSGLKCEEPHAGREKKVFHCCKCNHTPFWVCGREGRSKLNRKLAKFLIGLIFASHGRRIGTAQHSLVTLPVTVECSSSLSGAFPPPFWLALVEE